MKIINNWSNVPIPKGYKVKSCRACAHSYNGPDCDKCWNLRDTANGDYWVSKTQPKPFVKKKITHNDIQDSRIEHLEYMLATLLERLNICK